MERGDGQTDGGGLAHCFTPPPLLLAKNNTRVGRRGGGGGSRQKVRKRWNVAAIETNGYCVALEKKKNRGKRAATAGRGDAY